MKLDFNMENVKQNQVRSERIREILDWLELSLSMESLPPALLSVTDDSRKVIPDGIFVAVIGFETDGHLYLEKAVENGASLLVVESDHVKKNPELISSLKDIPILSVPNTRLAASILADEFYGHPSREIDIYGITGTKGKTTTAHLVWGILYYAGHRCAVMGTLGIEFEGKVWKSPLTTPGPIEFQRNLRFLADLGATCVVCEVSAHAGALSRTASVNFQSVTYMNLSRDHGDHFSDSEYLDAKLAIARDAAKLNPEVWGIANLRDSHAPEFLQPVNPGKRFTFAALEEKEIPGEFQCDLSATISARSHKDLGLTIRTSEWERKIRLPLIGRFNAQNAAAAASIALKAGIEPDMIASGLEKATPVPGRLENIDLGQDFLVVVDYAHAPQPAAEVLAALRDITPGRLIGVMGCGGSRDRGKRPMVGEILARDCDIAVITSDNPRREEPLDIINDILVGVNRVKNNSAEIIIEVDRRMAIGEAVSRARSGDTVAILGKGHEDYQIFMDRTIHFDDREVAREWLEARGKSKNE